jgi:hypothetical protein
MGLDLNAVNAFAPAVENSIVFNDPVLDQVV